MSKVQREDIDPKFQLEEFNVMEKGRLFNCSGILNSNIKKLDAIYNFTLDQNLICNYGINGFETMVIVVEQLKKGLEEECKLLVRQLQQIEAFSRN